MTAAVADPHTWRQCDSGAVDVPFDADCIACGCRATLRRYWLGEPPGVRELHIRALTLIPVTCEQLVVGDRVKVKHDGKPGAIYKVISPGYFQVAIDGDTPFCAPGDEQWHPYFLISGLEPIDK